MSRLGMHLSPRIYHRSGFVLVDRIFWGRQNLCKRLRFGLRVPWRLVPVRFGIRKVLIRQVRSEDLGGGLKPMGVWRRSKAKLVRVKTLVTAGPIVQLNAS